MKYVGVDLHKHAIVLCIVVLVAGRPKVVKRAQFACRPDRGDSSIFPRAGAFSGRRRGDRRLRMVLPVDRRPGRPRSPGTPQKASGDRREHAEERQDRRRGAGRILGLGHDSPSLSANAAYPPASGSGAAPLLVAAADHVAEMQGAQRPGPLQRRHRGAVHTRGRAVPGGRAAFAGRSFYSPGFAGAIGLVPTAASRSRSAAGGIRPNGLSWPSRKPERCWTAFPRLAR